MARSTPRHHRRRTTKGHQADATSEWCTRASTEQSPRQWRRRRLVFAAADQPQQEEEEERWLVGALANGGAVAVMAVMVVMEDMAMAVAVAMGRVVVAPAALDAQEVTAAMDRRQ